MTITFKKNFDVKKIATDLQAAQKKTLEIALHDEVAALIKRTQSGTDADGSSFRAYTKDYAKKRAKAGRGTSPDLTYTGAMLRAIDAKVETDGNGIKGTIFFRDTKSALKARGNNLIRRFFALSKEQIDRIKQRLKDRK